MGDFYIIYSEAVLWLILLQITALFTKLWIYSLVLCQKQIWRTSARNYIPRYCGCNYLFVPLIDTSGTTLIHDDVIKWKYFPRYWPFVRRIYRSPVNSPHKGQWRGALMGFFYLHPNKRLSKQWRGWWFETPSCPLWRHRNDLSFLPVHEWMGHDKVGVASDGEKHNTSIPDKLAPILFNIIRFKTYGSIKPQYPGMTEENFLEGGGELCTY